MPITIIALACFLLGGGWAFAQTKRESDRIGERARKTLAWLAPLAPPLVVAIMLDRDVFTRGWAVAVMIIALIWLIAYAWYILLRCRRKRRLAPKQTKTAPEEIQP